LQGEGIEEVELSERIREGSLEEGTHSLWRTVPDVGVKERRSQRERGKCSLLWTQDESGPRCAKVKGEEDVGGATEGIDPLSKG